VADDVGRQLVHGQDHVLGLVFAESGPAGAGPDPVPGRVQRAGIEAQVEQRRQAVGVGRSRPARADPAATSG
jgi:hypothetical protein